MLCLLPISLILLQVHSFGFISFPPSRQAYCTQLAIPGSHYISLCSGAQDEPHRVGSLPGAPFQRPIDHHLCNGGAAHNRWDGLNTQGPKIWPRTPLRSNSSIVIEWELLGTALGTTFEYYISKPLDGNRTTRLSAEDLEREPLLVVRVRDEVGHGIVKHVIDSSRLRGREGYAVIYGVFNALNGRESFYNCVDVAFEHVEEDDNGYFSSKSVQEEL